MAEDDRIPPYTVYHFEKYTADLPWEGRIHERLFDAGLITSATPEHSPIASISIMQAKTRTGEPCGERILKFMLVCKWRKPAVDAAFAPYKASRVADRFLFCIPLSFFEPKA